MKSRPWLEAVGFSLLAVLLTWQPFYLQQKINTFELGLYLPAINAILDGAIPYRDVFHLRGPFELYLPALYMSIFGESVAALCTYFYLGTLATLVALIILARQVLTSRFILAIAIPVIVIRTFPRVVFTYWGGMRYAVGLLALICLVQYVSSKKKRWLLICGFVSAGGWFVSPEIGVCAIAATAGTLGFEWLISRYSLRRALTNILLFTGGFFILAVPYLVYLSLQGALHPYINATLGVVLHMQEVFPPENNPKNVVEGLLIAVHPGHDQFKNFTPVYTYLAFFVYMGWRLRSQQLSSRQLGLVAVGIYGLVMFLAAFRNIQGAQFEMALQPAKLVLFFLIERLYVLLKQKGTASLPGWKGRRYLFYGLCGVLIISSMVDVIQRLNKRYYSYRWLTHTLAGKDVRKLEPLAGQSVERLNLPRLGSMTVPVDQAADLREVSAFFEAETKAGERVMSFPEMGFYNFVIDRPLVGRFPHTTLAWIREDWHREVVDEFRRNPPRYALMPKELPFYFEKQYFQLPSNRARFEAVKRLIQDRYDLIKTTPNVKIYKRK